MFYSEKFKQHLKILMKKPVVIKLVSFLIFIYIQLINLTIKWEIKGKNNIRDTKKGAILVGWHARAAMLPYFWQRLSDKKLYALVSPHQDGLLMANFLKFYDIEPLLGSTNHNATQSALEIMRLLNDGANIFISPDGPRGPRMRMKKSPIYFASKTGLPIIGVSVAASRYKLVEKAWDKTMIVFPFGRGIFAITKPFYVPADLTDEQIEEYRQKLEDIINDLSFECDKKMGVSPVLPGEVGETKSKRF